MDMITATVGFLTGYMVPFILVLSLLVFVHEMGHYLVGRWCGIRSTAFSVGFGPELIGFTDKRGTRWKISAIPLGGYVKFFGDEDVSSKPDSDSLSGLTLEERAQTLAGAKLWKRAATVAAGPIANFILAILIFAALFTIYGRMISDPIVSEVRENSAAQTAGVLPGDRLVAIDGENVKTFEDVRRYVAVRPATSITVTVERNGQQLNLPMVPTRTERWNWE
jgi:regulator of sigma E protease